MLLVAQFQAAGAWWGGVTATGPGRPPAGRGASILRPNHARWRLLSCKRPLLAQPGGLREHDQRRSLSFWQRRARACSVRPQKPPAGYTASGRGRLWSLRPARRSSSVGTLQFKHIYNYQWDSPMGLPGGVS